MYARRSNPVTQKRLPGQLQHHLGRSRRAIGALEAERAELEDDISDFKAWPVVSLAFVYNF